MLLLPTLGQKTQSDLCVGFCILPFICGSQCFTYAEGIFVQFYICRNRNKNKIAALNNNRKLMDELVSDI